MEADKAVERAEEAEAKNKKYEHLLLEKEQEITSLQHKISVLDGDLEKAETKLTDLKSAQEDGEQSKTANEGLQRKIQLLEEELDAADKNLKDAMEKCVAAAIAGDVTDDELPRTGSGRSTSRPNTSSGRCSGWSRSATSGRRSTRCVHLVGDRSCLLIAYHCRLQEAQEKYRQSKAELDELVANMESL